MIRGQSGFTIAELIVVVVIIAILAVVGIPKYHRAVEHSKSDDAIATVQMLATTNRMWALDHNSSYVYGSGFLNDTCTGTGACCYQVGTCGNSVNNVCNLMQCNYLARMTFSNKEYDFRLLDGAASTTDACGLTGANGTLVACAKRKASAQAPYNGWGYAVDVNGRVTAYGTDVPQPRQ